MASKSKKKRGAGAPPSVRSTQKAASRPATKSIARGAGAGVDKRLLIGGGLLALIVVAVLVAVSVGGGGGDDGPVAGELRGAAESAVLLDGIPQDGALLGSPDAPVTLVEYGDLQCPFCADWSTQTFPTIVEDYVRPGDVRLEFRGLTFLDDALGTTDSDQALRAAIAAGEQGKLWNVLELLYANQGEEGAGWVSDELLRDMGEAVPGLDVELMLEALESDATTSALEQMRARADVSGVNGTPSFEAGPSGQQLSVLELTSLEPDGIRPALDALLAR